MFACTETLFGKQIKKVLFAESRPFIFRVKREFMGGTVSEKNSSMLAEL